MANIASIYLPDTMGKSVFAEIYVLFLQGYWHIWILGYVVHYFLHPWQFPITCPKPIFECKEICLLPSLTNYFQLSLSAEYRRARQTYEKKYYT